MFPSETFPLLCSCQNCKCADNQGGIRQGETVASYDNNRDLKTLFLPCIVFFYYFFFLLPYAVRINISANMELFVKNLPKIELHAHLNGSLSTESIKELGLEIYGENSEQFLKMLKEFSHFSEEDKLEDCFQKFTFMHDLTSTQRGLQLATEMVIRDFALDNAIYLELRTTPKSNANMSCIEYLETIVEVIKNQSKNFNIDVLLLVSVNRAQSVEVAEDIFQAATQVRDQYPHIVLGMDFSGNPYVGKFNDFRHIFEKAKRANFKLALHCAEISNEEEIQEMLDFDFERCGHGTYLTDQQLIQCCKQNIALECCLTSNVKSGTVKSYDSHHFVKACEKNVKTVLCTDDSGVFDTTLSQEFAIACRTYNLNKTKVYELSTNAVEVCFADSQAKTRLHTKLDKYFKSYSLD